MAAKTNVIEGTEGDDALIGTGGQDRIVGGAGNDLLAGRDGRDRIVGGAGDDTLAGDAGDDTLIGGTGYDTFFFQAEGGDDTILDFNVHEDVIDISHLDPSTSFWESVRADKGEIWATLLENTTPVHDENNPEKIVGVKIDLSHWDGGTITLMGVLPGELSASNFDTWAAGHTVHTIGDTTVAGTDGDDTLRGGFGNDEMDGGKGSDKMYGGAGNDQLSGGRGRDTLDGGAGNDILDGGKGDDTLTGGAGGDLFRYTTGGGDDVITDFDASEDVLDLSTLKPGLFTIHTMLNPTKETSWQDFRKHMTEVTDPDNPGQVTGVQIDLSGWGGGTITLQGVLLEELTADNFRTWIPGRDLRTGDETITGTGAADTLRGGLGTDVIYGGGGRDELDGGIGNDRLDGGKGNDTLIGGAGNDKLTGGKGRDTFVHEPGDGHDTITDFTDQEDMLDLSAFTGIGQFSDLTAMLRQDGDHVVIDLSDHGGGTITLQNVAVDDLDADDFIFFDVPVEGGV